VGHPKHKDLMHNNCPRGSRSLIDNLPVRCDKQKKTITSQVIMIIIRNYINWGIMPILILIDSDFKFAVLALFLSYSLPFPMFFLVLVVLFMCGLSIAF
jgi:hypothetical protein